MFTFPVTGISVAQPAMVIIVFQGFQITTTVLQHLRLHYAFTFPESGKVPALAGDRGKLE
ncbi:hypothetical protein HMPREF3191_01115 [Veillonellaceae bacterium DNF00626]|nr:hypothetical protein HMPREF3191_01115 [Veillonellaceae bacterium DNF00626]